MKTVLRIQNINTFIEGDFPRVEVDKALSYYIPGFFMSKLYRICQRCPGGFQKINAWSGKCPVCGARRVWDGKKHLLLGGKLGKPYFPTGCLTVVASVLEQNGLQAVYIDERSPCLRPSPEDVSRVSLIDPKDATKTRTLWGHQSEAVGAVLKYERGVIQIPTSGGKSSVLSAVCKLVPEPAVILINNKSIAKQLHDEVEAMLGEDVGLIMGGVFEPRRVTIAMTQSLISLLSLDKKSKKEKIPALPEAVEFANRIRVLLMDECHHASSDTWYTLCNYMKNAYYRVGVTGTAFMRASGDDLLLIGATGGLIHEIPEQELISLGIIARPIIHWYRIPEPNNIPEDAKYQDVYNLGVVNNLYLNRFAAMKIKEKYDNGSQILVLFRFLDHIKNMEAELDDGIEYEVLTGEDDLDRREMVKSRFITGKLKVILASGVFDEGVSIENIDDLFRMGLGKGDTQSKQQVGRSQRLKKGKPQECHIHDFLHTTHRFLTEHTFAHFKLYRDLGYEQILEETSAGLVCLKEDQHGVQSSII